MVTYVIVILIHHHKFDIAFAFKRYVICFLLKKGKHMIPSGRGASQKHFRCIFLLFLQFVFLLQPKTVIQNQTLVFHQNSKETNQTISNECQPVRTLSYFQMWSQTAGTHPIKNPHDIKISLKNRENQSLQKIEKFKISFLRVEKFKFKKRRSSNFINKQRNSKFIRNPRR